MSCLYTNHHQEALELELSVLSSLLKRNRCSHQRTRYYQRIDMALRFVLKKSQLLHLWTQTNELQNELRDFVEKQKTKRQRQRVFWEMIPVDPNFSTSGSSTDNWRDRLDSLVYAVVAQQLPAALSRIRLAADALFRENIVRGFFLPFSTAAVAALARIRVLLVQLGGHVVSVALPQLQGLWNKLQQEHYQQQQERILLSPAPAPAPAPLWNKNRAEELAKLQEYLASQQSLQNAATTKAAENQSKAFVKRALQNLSLPKSSLTFPSRRRRRRSNNSSRGHDTTSSTRPAATVTINNGSSSSITDAQLLQQRQQQQEEEETEEEEDKPAAVLRDDSDNDDYDDDDEYKRNNPSFAAAENGDDEGGMDDDDIGESVAAVVLTATTTRTGGGANSPTSTTNNNNNKNHNSVEERTTTMAQSKSLRQGLNDTANAHPIDKNQAMVEKTLQQMKKDKQKQKKKKDNHEKKKRKSESDNDDNGAAAVGRRGELGKAKKKQKRDGTKTMKKKDFFDDLFGS